MDIGRVPREEPEGLCRLVHAHGGAAHHPAPPRTSAFDQFGFERRIDDIRYPMECLDSVERDRNAWYPEHADRCGVDQPSRAGERRLDVCHSLAAAGPELENESTSKPMRPICILVVNEQHV